MDWRLLEYAKEAEDTASGLHIFLSEIPAYSKDITGDIAELFAISSALHVLHEDLELSRYGRYTHRILRDLEICLPSLGYTLDDVRNMFSKSKNRRQAPGAFPGTPPYAEIWEDACADLKAQGISLPGRLSMYRTYLQGMQDLLRGVQADDEVDIVRGRLAKLLKKQEPIEDYFSRIGIGGVAHVPARTPQPSAPSAPRPHVERFQTYPNTYGHPHPPPPPVAHSYVPPPPPISYAHTPPPVGRAYPPPGYGHPTIPPPPPLPPRSPMPYGEIPFIPPIVPEVPQSPTFSNASSHSFSTQSNDSGGPVAHWAMKIFDGRHSSTPFQILGQPTRCLGRDEPQAIEMLDGDGFQKVLETPFEATNVWVRLYWRTDDNRARILFLTLDPSGRKMRFCFPLTGLKVIRTESCLQLCRVNRQDGKLDLWANLRFTLYERMVLFYCTLVALKRQDDVQAPKGLDDYFQPGEKEEFGGELQDDKYLHAFRIFRDKDSGGVRFEATPRRGPMKTIPIWTAFVTQYIRRKSWMKRIGHSTIQFRELHPYIFCEGYRLPRGKSGRYQLTFTTPEDARVCMDVFHRIKTR